MATADVAATVVAVVANAAAVATGQSMAVIVERRD